MHVANPNALESAANTDTDASDLGAIWCDIGGSD